jgi:DNA-directed RNA polymerase alpha subunit
MTDKKCTDPGLSAGERKELSGREAKEAIAGHGEAQWSLHENRDRLRGQRIEREASVGPILYPAPEVPNITPIDRVRFSTRIRNALLAAGWKTVGDIREASDATLLSLQDLGKGSVTHLRETLGLPPKEGTPPSEPEEKK